jgi:hypothetical protein
MIYNRAASPFFLEKGRHGSLRMSVRPLRSAGYPGWMSRQPPGGKGLGAPTQRLLILERSTPEHLKVTTFRGASMMG